jgi:hypothetical protein
MPDNRFPILGDTVPPMLGRTGILRKMIGALAKQTPDHLQVVGPKFAGKTVILNELAARLRQTGAPYSAVVLWDLGHQTPSTDELFMQSLARELSAALKGSYPDYADYLRNPQGNPYQDIAEILDILKDDGVKVLAIMDGFDKPLANSQLTRNLWDQLLDLARKPSLRLVTASRRSLYQLLRNPESQTSDFWGIFDTKIHVGCFDEDDLAAIFEVMPEIQLSAGAKTELLNAGNGFPIFTLGVINSLCESGATGTVSQETMMVACDDAFSKLHDKLDALWTDCTQSCQDLLRRVLEEKQVGRAGIVTADAEMLIERGFVLSAANKLQRPSRLIGRYLEEQPHEGSALVRLFGSSDGYEKHLKYVLERRINQIDGIDAALKCFLLNGVHDLPEFPQVFLSHVHGILEQALSQIWKIECWNTSASRPQIPSEWFSTWQRTDERYIEDWQTRFPEGGQRLRLLDLITGTRNTDRLARYVTKNTYVLANAVQGFRDFGVHPKAMDISLGTAYVALHTCIELAASLSRELPRQ